MLAAALLTCAALFSQPASDPNSLTTPRDPEFTYGPELDALDEASHPPADTPLRYAFGDDFGRTALDPLLWSQPQPTQSPWPAVTVADGVLSITPARDPSDPPITSRQTLGPGYLQTWVHLGQRATLPHDAWCHALPGLPPLDDTQPIPLIADPFRPNR